MLNSHRWQSRTALLIALAMTSTVTVPFLSIQKATAQSQPHLIGQSLFRSGEYTILAGTIIPIESDAEKIIVKPNETVNVTLKVAEDILSSSGRILIPRGSKIKGKMQPAFGGTQFVAQDLILERRREEERVPIDATSEPIIETEIIDEKTDPDVLRGAIIGAAAGAVLSEIFGDIDLGEVLAGAGVGVLAELLLRGKEEVEVVIVDPNRDLDLTLESDLQL